MVNSVLENCMILPMIALRGVTVFPGQLFSFDVERRSSIEALNASAGLDRLIFLSAQRDSEQDIPEGKDIYPVGTVCRLRQHLLLPGGSVCRVLVEGLYRGYADEIRSGSKFLSAEIYSFPDRAEKVSANKKEALIRSAIELFNEYIQYTRELSPEQLLGLLNQTEPAGIADFIAQNLVLPIEEKQELLEELRPCKRLERLVKILNRELNILEIEKELNEGATEAMQERQREYFLHEQLRLIQEELGGGASVDDIAEYRERVKKLECSEEIKAKLVKEINRLSKEPFGSSEAAVVRSYLDACLELPFGKKTDEITDVKKAEKILDADHYGLEKVKERILEYLAVRQLSPEIKGGLICLVGPPGTGKTSVAMSVARATGRKLVRISLGGVHDEAEIRGHRKTYLGSMPGRIMNGIIQSGVSNPLMVMDEIDKLGSDYKGDPASALLEVFDGEQNTSFRDNFLEIPFDLSEVFFITTANTTESIPRALLDRMEVIELNSYTDEEKLIIAKKYLLPKQRKKHGLKASQLKLSDEAILRLISSYTKESGVRQLERQLAALCRKTAMLITEGKKAVSVTPARLTELLGPERVKADELRLADTVGLVRGLAWTEAGGEVLDCEAAVLEGSGKLELTGNLGDVMKESVKAGLTCIRARAELLGIEADFYKTKDIHVHFPEGAIPKDGPSAGVTVCTAMISALTGRPVNHCVAMTGEITLRGRVLPIGGLKEKTMAALRSGVTTVIIPSDNESDLEEIDPIVKSKLNFIFARTIDDVISAAFAPFAEKEKECRQSTTIKFSSSNQQRIRSSS